MLVISGKNYEDKCAKVADAFSHLSEGRELLSNFLAAIDAALLDEDEEIIAKMSKHFAEAQKSLDTF
jgi:hypothetical protein